MIFLISFVLSIISLSDKNVSSDQVAISVLVDESETWTYEHLSDQEIQRQFDLHPLDNPYFGYTTKPHWFRVILPDHFHGENTNVIINYPSIRDIRLYDGNKAPQLAGRNVPVDNWPNKARNIVFNLNEDHADTIYLRAQEKASLIVPIAVKLERSYKVDSLVENILYGFFFGFVIAMILYNLMLFLSLRDVTYFYYIIAMAAGGLVAAIRAGYAIVYWWPNNSILDDRIYLICGGVSVMASSRFVSNFLGLTQSNKKIDLYLWVVSAMAAGMVVLTFFLDFVQLTNYGRLLVAVGIPSFLGIGIWKWTKGYRPARFFVLAWIPYIAGLVLIVLKGGGWVPYSPLVDISAEVGTCLEAILLSFALGDRISSYKKAKSDAEKKVLKTELEHKALLTQNQRLDYELKLKEKDLQNEHQQLATTTLWLTQKNKVLQDLQQSLKALKNGDQSAELKLMSKKVEQNLNAEEDWMRFKEHFEKVHTGFFSVLQQDFPALTNNEHRLCAYLRMNMSTKEIATLQGVSTTAIEQARRRMRKKIGISNTETNLHTFLQNLA
ncbi:MAG: 7TM diverse intracellular signaling domain-containing protein [Cyclobacteriaceae bacterium]